MQLEHEVLIAAPVERVWALTVDIANWPKFTPTMQSVEPLDDGPVRVGTQARVKQPGQRPTVWTVSELNEGSLFAWGTTLLGVRMVGRHELYPAPEGTRNRLVLELDDGLRARILTALVGRQLRASLAKENAGFKAAAEG